MADKKQIATFAQIEARIYVIRGHKIMLDTDLSWLYGVQTRALIQAVKRNRERFPEDFMFQLSKEEFDSLRSQSVISNLKGRGGRRYRLGQTRSGSHRHRHP